VAKKIGVLEFFRVTTNLSRKIRIALFMRRRD
jgi:hypothetical protein